MRGSEAACSLFLFLANLISFPYSWESLHEAQKPKYKICKGGKYNVMIPLTFVTTPAGTESNISSKYLQHFVWSHICFCLQADRSVICAHSGSPLKADTLTVLEMKAEHSDKVELVCF